MPPVPARLLDLTRLIRRAGRPMTGVDRVEHAYLVHLLQAGTPIFGIVRTALGYALLNEKGCTALLAILDSGDWDAPDALSRPLARRDPMRARAETTVRRLALARRLPLRLTPLLAWLPKGFHYINTGHSNLSPRMCRSLGKVGARIAVLVHDTIPLDFPDYQRPETLQKFRAFLRRAGSADLVICNSRATEADVKRHLAAMGLHPQTVAAPLGVPRPRPGPAPQGAWTGQPFFVSLGTIEPRKNHALLLDLWDDVAAETGAHLLLCGARGWENAQVFARLDAQPRNVHELPGLSDAQVAGLLTESAGLLFPSHAEGYGLPPIEAAALGVPVVCNDLPVYRETLGNIPVYADVKDRYLWKTTITALARDGAAGRSQPPKFDPPDWKDHFKTVLTLI